MSLGNSKNKAPHSLEWPQAAGPETVEAPGAGRRPRAPSPQPFPRLLCPWTPKEENCPRLHFTPANDSVSRWHRTKAMSLCCSLCVWELGQQDAWGHWRGLWERLQSFSPAAQCHRGCPLPPVPVPVPPAPSPCSQPFPVECENRAVQGETGQRSWALAAGPVPGADKQSARGEPPA